MDDRYRKENAVHRIDGYMFPCERTRITKGKDVENVKVFQEAKRQAISAMQYQITDIENMTFEQYAKIKNN